MRRRLLILLSVLSVLPAACFGAWRTDYDSYFRLYVPLHFGADLEPAYVKAEAIAESALRWDAKSPAGAQGMMQFMPATWLSVAPEPWKSLGPLDPEAAVYVGCKYLRQLWKLYPSSKSVHRKSLMSAGYNSGPGNIRKAQHKCAMKADCDPNQWDEPNVESNLVTAARFQLETRGYIRRIRSIFKTLAPL